MRPDRAAKGSESSRAREASDYFNSLPIEQRKKLAPLLEDYRRLGIEEGASAMRAVCRGLETRARSIKDGSA